MNFRRPPTLASSRVAIARRAYGGRLNGGALGTAYTVDEVLPGMYLRTGDTGPVVTEVQKRLLFLGYSVSADGVYGYALDSALAQFAKDIGYHSPALNYDLWSRLVSKARERGYVATTLQSDGSTPRNVIDINVDGALRTIIRNGVATGEKPFTAEEGGFTDFNYGGGTDPRVAAAEKAAAAAGGGAALPSNVGRSQQQLTESSSTNWPLIIGGGALLIGAVVLLTKKRK